MSFLAQITLNRAEAARQCLHGLYEWHDLSWKLFPDKSKEDKRDFITRLDTDEHEFKFTVLSANKPKKPSWCISEYWKERVVPESFYQKDRYFFKVFTNPTKTLSRRDPKGNKKNHGSHYAIIKPEELRIWFLHKGEQHGFRILDEPELEISPPVFHKLYRKSDEGLLVGVEFKGCLEVTNKTEFIKVACEGLGRARGFGFGMIVLKPIL
ncbi:MAG: type I-E CRISPR-associated protein Cas6/Cse3/CasE [Chitinispirillaceae bacterium]|nr:type I-E CRISPR-associated protein Cas6/Cse3/CasE [Chitinispirillaceae bacterium]